MKITKFAHCCLLIEEGGLKILTDPGLFSDGQNSQTGIDVVLITHEHADHFHVPSVLTVLHNNPQAFIITNSAVAALLKAEGIEAKVLESGQNLSHAGVRFEAFGTEHAAFHPLLPVVMNTGYFIGDRLFYPGDALTVPGRPVDVLAFPAAGPWMKFSEAVDYVVKVQPSVAFPVHEGVLVADFVTPRYAQVFEQLGVHYIGLKPGETKEF
jgi:L-ascorbate metabolism protein UlaG (beta-lactamase superfamily)